MEEEIVKTQIPSKKQILEFCEKNDLISLAFFEKAPIGTILYYILFFFPIPLLIYLIDRWIDQKIYLRFCFDEVDCFENTDVVVIMDQGENVHIIPLTKEKLLINEGEPELECFTFFFIGNRYCYNNEKETLENIIDQFGRLTIKEAINKYKFGRYINENLALLKTFGENKIDISKPNIIEMLVSDMLSFMGAFEICCVTLVIVDGNIIYLIFVLSLVSFSKVMMILDGFHQYNQIQKYLTHSNGIIVIRKNEDDCFSKMTISIQELVPGDIIELTSNLKIPVDALIISGSCMIDEKGYKRRLDS
jgi:magnesium-transporting ATPase (P-type)